MQDNLSGIYCIENLVNHKKYIGMSRDIKRRYATANYGINKGSISSCIKGKLKSAGKHPITGERLTWELIEK